MPYLATIAISTTTTIPLPSEHTSWPFFIIQNQYERGTGGNRLPNVNHVNTMDRFLQIWAERLVISISILRWGHIDIGEWADKKILRVYNGYKGFMNW